MKKVILITILCSFPLTAFGETACPKGRTECDIPCGICVDKDNNGICDYIQSNTKQKDIVKKPESGNQKAPLGISTVLGLKDSKDVSPVNKVTQGESSELKKEIPSQRTQNIKPPIKPAKTLEIIKESPIKKPAKKKLYHLLPLSLSLFFLYFASIILYKKKILKPQTHFKFWNFALLFSFLISGLLGIILVIMINYGIRLKLPFNILFWHTEAGIAMFAISLFHIHWHWGYIKNMFKKVK